MTAPSRKQGRYEAIVGRGLEGFQRRSVVELQPSGVAELGASLGGGFPRGSLVELCGAASSWRTSLAFSLLAQASEHQEACAFVDVFQARCHVAKRDNAIRQLSVPVYLTALLP